MSDWPNLTQRIAELETLVRTLKAERDALLMRVAVLESSRDDDAWRREG